MPEDLAALHEPYAALLQSALLGASPLRSGPALDLASGRGLKRPWLAASMREGSPIVSLDHDFATLASGPRPAFCADAHMLPFMSGSFARCWCVAALGLFASKAQVLSEVRRVLQPGGDLVMAVAGQYWACLRRWPDELWQAFQAEQQPTVLAFPPADGLADWLKCALAQGQFVDITIHAYVLQSGEQGVFAAALPLLDWPAVREHYAPLLSEATCSACDRIAEELAEPELVEVLFVAQAATSDK
jgi:SAM-dependent methyltransferase